MMNSLKDSPYTATEISFRHEKYTVLVDGKVINLKMRNDGYYEFTVNLQNFMRSCC